MKSAHTDRILKIVLAHVLVENGVTPSALAESLAEALGPDLYITDLLIHRIDPAFSTEPEYTGICDVCHAEIDGPGLETHTDDCALAAAIIARDPNPNNEAPEICAPRRRKLPSPVKIDRDVLVDAALLQPARFHKRRQEIDDCAILVGLVLCIPPTFEEISARSEQEILDATIWAASTHLHSLDDQITVFDRPEWLKPYAQASIAHADCTHLPSLSACLDCYFRVNNVR